MAPEEIQSDVLLDETRTNYGVRNLESLAPAEIVRLSPDTPKRRKPRKRHSKATRGAAKLAAKIGRKAK